MSNGWWQALGVVAGLAVGAGVGYGAWVTFDQFHDASAVPETTASASPSPTPTATAEGCRWVALPDEERPPVLTDEPEGLPAARAMDDAVWDCVDESWSVETRSSGGDTWRPGGEAQALYLVAPDGDLLKLFDLRTDVEVVVVSYDLDARLAWTARVGFEDSFQVIQVGLDGGLVVEDWGGPAVPSLQRLVPGSVWDVVAVGAVADGDELWIGYRPPDVPQSLFLRGSGGEFHPVAGQRAIDSLRNEGGVNAVGGAGQEVWVAPDLSYALVLSQRPGASEFLASGGGTWVIVDLDAEQWRLAEASLPGGLCTPAPDAALTGTAADPGVIEAVCWTGPESQSKYELRVGGDPVEVG